jgi:hypothetical protein
MLYDTQDYWVFGLFPWSDILSFFFFKDIRRWTKSKNPIILRRIMSLSDQNEWIKVNNFKFRIKDNETKRKTTVLSHVIFSYMATRVTTTYCMHQRILVIICTHVIFDTYVFFQIRIVLRTFTELLFYFPSCLDKTVMIYSLFAFHFIEFCCFIK